MSKIAELKKRLSTVWDLKSASNLLSWDQQTYMPPHGADSRARQLATLDRLAHEILTGDETARLIEDATREVNGAASDSDEACLLRVARRHYDRGAKVPAHLVEEFSRTCSLAHEAWVEARRSSDFPLFAPHLSRILELCREMAECRGYPEHPFDSLIDEFEPGATASEVRAMFDEMRPRLVALVQAVEGSGVRVDASLLHQRFDVTRQTAFARFLAEEIGYDFKRGRQDVSAHPFCTSFSAHDVRITVRYLERFVSAAIFGALHEAGHALYEQGSPDRFNHTPLRGGASLGLHESQSRLWENLVGRSRPFWRRYFPKLASFFPEQLHGYSVEDFYRAINRVEPSLIRVEADEVTYNLHIMVRFELELEMLEGKLAVKDVPEAWNHRYEQYLGVVPANDSAGCLQDIHWAHGILGYFPTYSIGNVLASQLWEQISRDLPDLEAHLEAGRFDPLRGWLVDKLHSQAKKFLPKELVQRVTGSPLNCQAFLGYLERKFGDIYGLVGAPR
ncbi:MAG: carboxypeptidase M32 [Candidatus Eremiobacterota bacterium]